LIDAPIFSEENEDRTKLDAEDDQSDGIDISAVNGPIDNSQPTQEEIEGAIDTLGAWLHEDRYSGFCRSIANLTLVKNHRWSAAHYVDDVFHSFVDRLDRAPTRGVLQRRLASYTIEGHFYRAIINRHKDDLRALAQIEEFDEQDGHQSLAPLQLSYEAIERQSEIDSVALIVDVLVQRGRRDPRPKTCWTAEHIEVYLEMAGHGDGARMARERGLDAKLRSRFHKRLEEARSRARLTFYLAGVLAPPGNLKKPGLIHLHLDAHDNTIAEDSLTKDERALLHGASKHITTTPGHGQRVNATNAAAAHAKPKARQALRDQIADGRYPQAEYLSDYAAMLHDAEAHYAAHAQQTNLPIANCVTSCRPHNPNPDRVIWEA
jgi:hypothetical protein